MISTSQLLAFLITSVVLTATPGPDNLMVLSIGVARGRWQGMAFGLGCAVGCLSHTVLAVAGVSALLAASDWALTSLTWVGGLYLIWIGLQAIRSAGASAPSNQDVRAKTSEKSVREYFVKGLLANAINPKVVLFYLSFLPQFVTPSAGSVASQLGQLGVVFSVQAAVIFCLLAYFSGAIGTYLQRQPAAGAWLDRIAGGIMMSLGARMIWSR